MGPALIGMLAPIGHNAPSWFSYRYTNPVSRDCWTLAPSLVSSRRAAEYASPFGRDRVSPNTHGCRR